MENEGRPGSSSARVNVGHSNCFSRGGAVLFQAGAMLLRFMRPRPREPWRQSSVTRRRLRPDPFSLLKAALPLILTFVACLAPVTHAAATAAWSPPRFPAQPTEVVIIGTRHSAQLEYERSEEHTSELQSRENLVCRLLLENKKELELA